MSEPRQFLAGRGHVPAHVGRSIQKIARQLGAEFWVLEGQYWFTIPDGHHADAAVKQISEELRQAGVLALLISCTERQNRVKRSYR